MVNIYNKITFLFSNINYYADQNGSNGSFFTPNQSNPADDLESGKSDMVLQTSQQNHLSQDQKEHKTAKWNDEAEGTTLILRVNHSDEQGQNNQTAQKHIKYQNGTTVYCHPFAKACV